MGEIKLTVDGRELTAVKGQTVLQVALENGIHIPHLCYDPRLSPTGACRLCVVDIEGERGFQTSCSRQAVDGMTPELRKLRKITLELLASEHRLECTTCDRDGECLLQDYAYEYQIKEDRFPPIPLRVKHRNYTSGSLAIRYDPTKCVRCGRCVKI